MFNETELFKLERAAFRLCRLEIFNWGPFSGMHTAEIDADGTAIIGMTGSGKTTLVDAFMTLVNERPKYNLASTGGHESDRDLLSYIRGVVGSGNDSGDGAHIARKGKTTTGLCATYTDGENEVRIGGLFWINANSFQLSDLKRAWIFSREPQQSLEHWLSLLDQGGVRRLKQVIHDGQEEARVFDTSNGGKRDYLARVRSFFEVSDNAFALLNRAAGLKQLNSIDDIFRELVLDDHSKFDRAAEVAGDFDRLTEIHEELLTAQRQQRSLTPVARKHDAYLKCEEDLQLQQSIKRLLPVWVAENGVRLWKQQVAQNQQTLSEKKQALATLENELSALTSRRDNYHEQYLQAGGRSIEDLQALIAQKQKELDRLRGSRAQYEQLCQNLTVPAVAQSTEFVDQHAQLEQLDAQVKADEADAETIANKAGAEAANRKQTLDDIEQAYREAKSRPDSNLPSEFPRFRAALADAIELDPEQLPYVAELIEVQPEHAEWRGAIERAIGGNRLRMLVPSSHIKAALRWVNQQNKHRIHIRLLEADTMSQANAKFMEDGFTRKLNFKPHPLREALKKFLAEHDLHCVDAPELLAETPHAMTREGLQSGKRGYFEKKDGQRLEDNWFTGFDNKDRLKMLEAQRVASNEAHATAKQAFETANAAKKVISGKLVIIEQLRNLKFEEIDVATAQDSLSQLSERLQALLDPESDTAKVFALYQEADQSCKALEPRVRQAIGEEALAKGQLEEAMAKLDGFRARVGTGMTIKESELVRTHLPFPAEITAKDIGGFERRQQQVLDTKITKRQAEFSKLQTDLVRAMEHAQTEDTGALAEVGTEIVDIPAYLKRLDLLTTEALPKQLGKFLEYLNQSSDQGVTQLLTSISEAVSQIRERIEDLNRSLQSVDFKNGRYLRLVVQDVTHESLRTLERARKQLRAVALQTTEANNDNGERHYKALQHVVQLIREAADKKHTVGARALLDPRYRVEFHAVEIERATETTKDQFKGSQGGSGGEKEIIASYILTASLCYALSPEGGDFPLHSTIVLDEAFSKSSRTVANRIIQALREFKLHPIFVTPNKEMRLLRTHTKSVIYVHRKGFRATLTSISWEVLENSIAAKLAQTETTTPLTDEDA
ncbi:ATP-binding protein [Coraliomargarita sp. SDUM461003]|uniref:ATP-binding protein n=1 Tax=Thalassobacterium maritimum TaxID=3041265 RepID=A0ABU1AWA0_9BACT|nr:SbcC/MukB-like Walker B domain-containing protein [Coraliomargarita sp. SDUM461003]MDQ8208429.1 ATP-binding protein [Coraliomargarita sp. SDUM461003]